MSKVLSATLVVLLLASLISLGCSAEEEEEEVFLECGIELAGIEQVFVGKESATVDVVFRISNPNTFMVTLDELNYTLYVDGNITSTTGLFEDRYIPAKTDLNLRDGFTIPIQDFAGNFIMQGKSMQEAMGAAGAVWENIGKGMAKWRVAGEMDIGSKLGSSTKAFNLE